MSVRRLPEHRMIAGIAALALAATGLLSACGHDTQHQAADLPAGAVTSHFPTTPGTSPSTASPTDAVDSAIPSASSPAAPAASSTATSGQTTAKPAGRSSPTTHPPVNSPTHPPTGTGPTSGPTVPPKPLNPADLDSRAWLDPAETPLDDLYHWNWATMFPPANATGFPFTTGMPCITTTLDSLGATAVIPHDTDPAASAGNLPSVSIQERLFTFPDPAKAAAAFTTVRAAMNACAIGGPATAPGTHTTVTGDTAAAWATYPAPADPANPTAVFENHDYLTVHGRLISILTVGIAGTGQLDPDYHTSDDQKLLAAITRHLIAYN